MKKLLLMLAIFMLTFKLSYSQSSVYHPFPDANAVWIGTYWYNVGGSGPCGVYDDYNLYVAGDTTIGLHTYHKLYKNGYISSNCPPPGYNYSGQYWGAFRQDISSKKVFLFQYGADTLAYDFNLSVWDTLPATCLNDGFYNIVESIDSVLVGSIYHKRFRLTGNYADLIEGIGTTLGAFAPIVPAFESGNDLWCVRINDQVGWTSSEDNNCSLTAIKENKIGENQMIISPDPFSFATSLQTTNNLVNATLTVYNSFGQQVKTVKNISGQTFTFYRENLPAGLYFIRMSQDGKIITTDRLIICD